MEEYRDLQARRLIKNPYNNKVTKKFLSNRKKIFNSEILQKEVLNFLRFY